MRGKENLKRLRAHTGAKNNTIVLDNSKLDNAATQVLNAAFGSAGERCMACAVVAVQDSVADEFLELLTQKANEIKIGYGLDEGVFLGPLIRERSEERRVGKECRAL